MSEQRTADRYIGLLEGDRRAWIKEMIAFMRENYPHAREELLVGAPAYRLGGHYVCFAAGDRRFKFATSDSETVELLEELLPRASAMGDGVMVPYSHHTYMWTLFDAIRDIAKKSGRSS